MTHSDAECKVQRLQANNGSVNVTSIQYPCQHANIVSMQHPCQQATVANVQQPCQHTNATNVQQQMPARQLTMPAYQRHHRSAANASTPTSPT